MTGLQTTSIGGDDLQLGVKYEVVQQQGWRPMLTFVDGAVVPAGTRGVSANQMQPNAQVVFGWGLRRWLYLKGSTGVDFAKTSDATRVIVSSLQEGPIIVDMEDNVTQWHQSLSLLFQASPRVGGFVEWFSFFSNNGEDNRDSNFIDMGLYFYVTPNVQLDARIGQWISNRADTMFTGAGFSTRWQAKIPSGARQDSVHLAKTLVAVLAGFPKDQADLVIALPAVVAAKTKAGGRVQSWPL